VSAKVFGCIDCSALYKISLRRIAGTLRRLTYEEIAVRLRRMFLLESITIARRLQVGSRQTSKRCHGWHSSIWNRMAIGRADGKLKSWRRPRNLNVAACPRGSGGANGGQNRFPHQLSRFLIWKSGSSDALVVDCYDGSHLRCGPQK
jgi:hypothetical protein